MKLIHLFVILLLFSILFLSSEILVREYFESAFAIFSDYPLIPIIISMLTFTTLIGTIKVKESG